LPRGSNLLQNSNRCGNTGKVDQPPLS
jgi:hypothetical protein